MTRFSRCIAGEASACNARFMQNSELNAVQKIQTHNSLFLFVSFPSLCWRVQICTMLNLLFSRLLSPSVFRVSFLSLVLSPPLYLSLCLSPPCCKKSCTLTRGDFIRLRVMTRDMRRTSNGWPSRSLSLPPFLSSPLAWLLVCLLISLLDHYSCTDCKMYYFVQLYWRKK